MRKDMNKIGSVLFLLFVSWTSNAQEIDEQEKEKSLKTSTNLTWEGNKALSEDNFIAAEVDYRKAIAKSPDNNAAPYNLGNAYYTNETYNEAFGRFKEAGEIATSKADKHKAYHNMGNVFMKRKDYAKAVEAYKEALRNNPTDEETRYNLALAKELLKKDEEEKKQNQDDKDKEEKKDEDQKNDGENEDKKDQDQDQKEQGDKGEEKKDEDKEGEGDQKQDQKKKPEQGDKEQEQKQPRPNQLSKQQVENLLRAMQNAEKKVQDKIDAKMVKGVKVKSEKDW
jgi:tetratricopeptide (TPR) repeat protein